MWQFFQKFNFPAEKKIGGPKIFFSTFLLHIRINWEHGPWWPNTRKITVNFQVFFLGIKRAGSLQKLIFGYRAGSNHPKIGPSGQVFFVPDKSLLLIDISLGRFYPWYNSILCCKSSVSHKTHWAKKTSCDLWKRPTLLYTPKDLESCEFFDLLIVELEMGNC